MAEGKKVPKVGKPGMTMYFDKHRNDANDNLDFRPLPRLTMPSLMMGCLVSMGGLIFGYDTGQISGFLEMPDFLARFGTRGPDGSYSFSAVRQGLIVALLSIGTLIGALIAAPIADRIGRRMSISLWNIIVAIGFVIQVAAEHAWYQVMIGRLIAGFGVGALSLLVPMYQAETAPPWIRGALVCTYQLFITLGIFLAACFNYGTFTHQQRSSGSWRIVIGVGWLWTLVLGLGILFFPETPRYDCRHGRFERARATLCRFYGAPDNHVAVDMQMAEIIKKLESEDTVKGSVVVETKRMLRHPRMAYRIALGMTLQALQQLTGANYFFYYGTTIFQSVQINSFVTQMILNGINFGVTFIGLYLVEHYGRRRSLIAGSAWMFVCFMVFASVGHFSLNQSDPTQTQGAGIALIVFACLFILGFATTWGPMVWTIQAELFPSRYRAKGMALSTASNWIWNFLIAFFTKFITNEIDFMFGYVFAGCNFVAMLVVFFFVIEGQGRTLEEIDTMYVQRVRPIGSAKWVAPVEVRKRKGSGVATTESDAATENDRDVEKIGGNGQLHHTEHVENSEGVNGVVANGHGNGQLHHAEHA